jgi:hypothetical protein
MAMFSSCIQKENSDLKTISAEKNGKGTKTKNRNTFK